jgi:hypothetical protein
LSELHVALEEGFSGDDVTVRVDGTPVFEGRAIETRLQIGLAHSFAAEVPDGQRELVVEVPSRSIVHRQQLTVSGATYVGVSLRERSAEVRTSSEPFGYV